MDTNRDRPVQVRCGALADLLDVVDRALPQLDGVERDALRGAAAEVRVDAMLDAVLQPA